MSANVYSVKTGSVATTANATKSLWLVNPVTNRFVVAEISVSFDGSSAAAGIGIELYRTTTLGSPTGTSTTPVKVTDPNSAAADATSLTTLTAEPTAVEILAEWFVSPFGGLLDVQYPLGREPGVAAAGARIGLRYVTPASVSPNARSYVLFDV